MADIATPAGSVVPGRNAAREKLVAAATGALGDAVCVNSSGLAAQCDADAVGTGSAYGIVVGINSSGAVAWVAGDELTVITFGLVEGYASLTPGTYVWVSKTAGQLTQGFNGGVAANGDFGAGTFPGVVGVAKSATSIYVNPKPCLTALTA